MPNDGRQPRDLRGLLQFCMSADDNPSVSTSNVEVNEERRAWLNEVFEHLSVDVAGRMRELIRNLLHYVATPEEQEGLEAAADDDSGNLEEAAIEAVEELTDWTEDINFSIDFMKIGGFDLIPALLNSERALGERVRAQTAVLLSVLVQNNPTCQDFLLAHMEPVFVQLLNMVDTEESDLVSSKAVSAVSCSIRDHTGLQDSFVGHGGFPIFLRALQRGDIVRRRVSFVLASLLAETERFDGLVHGDIVERLVAILGESHEPWHEHPLYGLLLLTRRHLPSRAQCQEDSALRTALQERLEELADSPEHEESVAYSRSLCEVLEWPCSENDIPVLR